MLEMLKKLLGVPQPAGPAVSLHRFGIHDPTISQDAISVSGDAWRITGEGESRTVRLFELENPGVEQCMIAYRAQIKTEDVEGRAYLEMWCRLPGQGEFFSKGFHNALSGSNDWSSCEIPFYLKRNQRPDLLKLNLVVEGRGLVWMKDVELLQTPLK